MKKRMVLIFLGCMLLGGCQKNARRPGLREKGSASVENYEKAEDMEGTMAEQLSVPERYTAQVETEDKIYTMEAGCVGAAAGSGVYERLSGRAKRNGSGVY